MTGTVPGGDRVGLVIVSHSDLLARGVVELVTPMAADVAVIAAGGDGSGGLGTDVERVMRAVEGADAGAGVLVLADLGSAVMSAETAIELLGPTWSGRAVVSDGALAEGAVAASVRAQTGGTLAQVAEAAHSTSPGAVAAQAEASAGESGTGYSRRATLVNPDGLHARPAAEFVKLATGLGVKVTVNGKDARSLLSILSLGLTQGSEVEIASVDASGADAVDRLIALVESGFTAGE
ncbi:dihydroxyacetone kinase phosphoryl donor subunit DhaM [Humibacter albus]|jgi:PTS hybrid protein|uniref:dihydroxyacetone kinase phosphoryl donor subunit DhaM n=1 Tax=Humibacter albus TaxID=427754 RepID=UPI0003B77AAF|nr:dihydroxyacetone kinase phosphoryl donor subunit DhaM [Humibacter albus]